MKLTFFANGCPLFIGERPELAFIGNRSECGNQILRFLRQGWAYQGDEESSSLRCSPKNASNSPITSKSLGRPAAHLR